jgi:hypothetical protein
MDGIRDSRIEAPVPAPGEDRDVVRAGVRYGKVNAAIDIEVTRHDGRRIRVDGIVDGRRRGSAIHDGEQQRATSQCSTENAGDNSHARSFGEACGGGIRSPV